MVTTPKTSSVTPITLDIPPTPTDPENRIRRHLGEMIALAIPVMISRTGVLFLAVTDFAVLGRHSAEELSYFTLGQSPFIILMVVCIGLMLGTLISTSHAFGEGNMAEVGAVWRKSIPFALIIGIAFAAISLMGEGYFTLLQQPAELIPHSSGITAILGLSLIPTILFLTSSFFMEAIKKPMVVVGFILGANLLNYFGNILVVEQYGAEGVAWMTMAARSLMGFGLTLYVWLLPRHAEFSIRTQTKDGWWHGGKLQRRHGYAAGTSLGFETISFGVMGIFAGWLGAEALVIYGVTMNIMAVCFMLAVGLATATGVRVGIAHGRKDWHDRILAGWLGVIFTIIVLTPVALILFFMPETVVSFYLNEEKLVAASLSVIFLIGWIIFADGTQVIMQSSLRGSADKWAPTIISFFAYFIIMLPLGYVFTQPYSNGVDGLYYAIGAGSIFATSCLFARWIYLSVKIKNRSNSDLDELANQTL